jgi:hypothetical protein
MLQDVYPIYVANRPVESTATLGVPNKCTGKVVARVGVADDETIDRSF